MPNPIKPKRSYSSGKSPKANEIAQDELAINWADGRLFTKNSSGQIVGFSLSGAGAAGISWQPVPASPSASGSNGSIAYDASFLYVKSASGWRRTAIASWTPLGAPTSVTATPGNAQATVNWTAPAENGGYAITDYAVQFSSNGGTSWTTFSDGTSTATSATVTGLTNGTAYVFRVAAINATGTGPYSSATSSVTPDAGDPYFSNVSLLLHMNGSNGSTTFTDSSGTPKTVTAYGSAQLSTAQAKFGDASGLLSSATSDRLQVTQTTTADFGSGDFVMEMFIRGNAPASGEYASLVVQRPALFNAYSSWSFALAILNDSGTSKLVFAPSSGNSAPTEFQWPCAVSNSEWVYIALVRSGNTLYAYRNGTLLGSESYSSTINAASSPLLIGCEINAANSPFKFFTGYIDELRITKGQSRGYTTSTISVPSAPFPDA